MSNSNAENNSPAEATPILNVYRAETDNVFVVHVDTPNLPENENGPLIRIYLNDEVIFENPPFPDSCSDQVS